MSSPGTCPVRKRSSSLLLRQPISGSAGELAQPRRRVPLRELRLRRDEQHVRILQHLGRLERPVGQRQVGEGEVELAALDPPQQVGDVGLLLHADLDARPLALEAAEEAGEDARADALVDADAERAGGALGERGHVRLGGVELRDDRVGVPEEQPSGLGQVDAPRPAGAVDEALADRAARAARSAG